MEAIFNLYKVKFEYLNSLMRKYDNDLQEGRKVNLFINLESVVRMLLNINTNDLAKVSQVNLTTVSSNIINLASHYRLYFSKRNMYSRIYLYFPSALKTYLNSSIVEGYRQTYYEKVCRNPNTKVISNSILDSTDIVKIICEYIEGVYFVESGNIENSLIPYIIYKENNDSKFRNFILSDDIYDFQYVNYGFEIIYPRKENSDFITKSNLIEFIKNKEDVDNESSFSSNILPFVLSIVGDKRRSIPKISGLGFKKVFKAITKAIENKSINENTDNINILSTIIKNEYQKKLISNHSVIDLNTQFNLLGRHDIYNIMKQVVDKFDDDSLKKLNSIYFSESPINLLEVTSGTNYKDDDVIKNLFKLR